MKPSLLVGRVAASGVGPPSTGLYIWLDADDAATITDSSGAVTAWESKGDYTGSFSVAASSNSPQTGARTVGGLNALDFDSGNSEALAAGPPLTLATSGAWTMFVVCETDTTSGVLPILGSDSTALRYGQLLRRNGTAIESIGFTSGSGPIVDAAGVSVSTATPFIAETYSTGTSIEALVDGSGDGAAAGSQRAATPVLWVGGDAQGASTVPIAYWNGAIAEVLCYNVALDSSDRTAVRDYLTTKWGL